METFIGLLFIAAILKFGFWLLKPSKPVNKYHMVTVIFYPPQADTPTYLDMFIYDTPFPTRADIGTCINSNCRGRGLIKHFAILNIMELTEEQHQGLRCPKGWEGTV